MPHEFTTTKIWASTKRILKKLAAENDMTMVKFLDELATNTRVTKSNKASQITPTDFIRSTSPGEISEHISGKTIASVVDDDGMDDWLVFKFTDGTSLHIRYDWIYEWYLKGKE